ncbi:MAG: CAP domain-containing protein [Ferrimicrobium sp.]
MSRSKLGLRVGLATLTASLSLTGIAAALPLHSGLSTSGSAVKQHPTSAQPKSAASLAAPVVAVTPNPTGGGYTMAAQDGGIFPFGSDGYYGSTYSDGITGLGGSHPLNAPIVGMAQTADGKGYWLVAKDGGVFNFGNASFEGSTYSDGITGLGGSHPLNAPIVGMAMNPAGPGYWLVAKDGGVFNFGGAPFLGSTYSFGITGLTGSHPLNAPIVGIAPTANGQGYWLVAKDGGVFNFGNASFHGSTYSFGITGLGGPHPLNAPIVGIAPTANGQGYWLVAKDGGVFNFGNASFEGSTYSDGITGLGGARPLGGPIVGMAATPTGNGYWLVGADGGVFNFGAAGYYGSVPSILSAPSPRPTVTSNPSGTSGTTAERSVSPPAMSLSNPSANIAPNFYATCGLDNGSSPNSVGCQQAAIAQINQARGAEGLPAMVLPSNYYSLTPAEQLFVLVNEERVSRGLAPALGLVAGISNDALVGAQSNTDPQVLIPTSYSALPFTGSEGANWAADYSTAASVFDWMYNDGLNSGNIDCVSGNTSGCWGHRANILLAEPSGSVPVMGTASIVEPAGSTYGGLESDTMVVGAVPSWATGQVSYTYTWAQAVAAGANPQG